VKQHLFKWIKSSIRSLLTKTRIFYIHLLALGPVRGFLVWLKWSIFRVHFEIAVTPSGSPVPVILRAGTTDIEVFKKIFIDMEYALPFDVAPSTIIDLGANTGLASIFFLSRYSTAQIIAVEPDPENFAMLKRHLGGLSNVTCVQAAVWTCDGQVNLIDPGIGSWGMQVSASNQAGGNERIVNAISMPTLLSQLPSGRVDLLKIDIEGAERELFSDSAGWIQQVTAIVIELHDRFKHGCSRSFFTAVKLLPNESWVGENIFVWKV